MEGRGQNHERNRTFGWCRRTKNYGQSRCGGAATGTSTAIASTSPSSRSNLIEGGQGQPPRPARCDDDPDRLPPRLAGVRALRPAVVVDRLRDRHHARAPRQGRTTATHPILGDECGHCGSSKRQSASPFVFASERGGPFTPSGSPSCWRAPARRPRSAFKVHPHMLRHRLRLCAGQQGHRYPDAAGLPRPSQHPIDCALH